MANDKIVNPFERNIKLNDSIASLHLQGARPIEWINDRLQKIIDEPHPCVKLDMTMDDYTKHVRLWEKDFPGEGHLIVDTIGWFLVRDHQVVPTEPLPELRELGDEALKFLSPQRRWLVLACDLRKDPRHSYILVSDVLEKYFEINYKGEQKARFFRALQAHRENQIRWFNPPTQIDFPYAAKELASILTLAIAVKLQGNPKHDLTNLLNLWVNGNIPLATEGETLLVHCKQP